MKNNVIEALMAATGYDEAKCALINEILNSHFLIGHNNKDKFKADFQEKLGMNEQEADDLYNKCAEIIVSGIFKR